MKKRRLISVLATVAVIASLFSGCAGGTSSKPESDAQDGKEKIKTEIKIGLSTDEGGKGDKSFNDSAILGLDRLKAEYTVEPDILEAKKKDEYEPFLTSLADKNDLVFGVGFLMQKSLETVAKAKPDKKFAIVDTEVKLPNVVSISFKEEQGSFLMGVIAGKTTKTNKIGFIGGVDMPLIQKFESGFIAGVKSVNPKAAEDLANRKNVRYTGKFDDPKAGAESAKQLYNSGIDIIYHASGSCGIGLLDTAKQLRDSGKDVWAIGVDMDQAITVPADASAILSSMVKRVDTATYEVSKSLIDGKFKGGETMVFGLEDNGIEVAKTSKNNTSKEVLDLVEKYRKAIIEGKVKVPYELKEVKNFKPVEIK